MASDDESGVPFGTSRVGFTAVALDSYPYTYTKTAAGQGVITIVYATTPDLSTRVLTLDFSAANGGLYRAVDYFNGEPGFSHASTFSLLP